MNWMVLEDRDSPTVSGALENRCGICKAAPGDPCMDTILGYPLVAVRGRWVHYERVELAA